MENDSKNQTPSSNVYNYPEQKRRYVVASVYHDNGKTLAETLLRLILSEISNHPDS